MRKSIHITLATLLVIAGAMAAIPLRAQQQKSKPEPTAARSLIVACSAALCCRSTSTMKMAKTALLRGSKPQASSSPAASDSVAGRMATIFSTNSSKPNLSRTATRLRPNQSFWSAWREGSRKPKVVKALSHSTF